MPQSVSESSVGLQSMTKEWQVQGQHIQSTPTNSSLSCSRGGPSHKGCTYDWLVTDCDPVNRRYNPLWQGPPLEQLSELFVGILWICCALTCHSFVIDWSPTLLSEMLCSICCLTACRNDNYLRSSVAWSHGHTFFTRVVSCRCNDSHDSVMYGRATRTSITIVSKFPRKTWGATHAQQWIPGAPLWYFSSTWERS